MTIGLVGRKCGMTRVFTDAGVTVPVTVVEALPNRISQIKSDKPDGYRAVQVTIGSRRPSRVPKALAGHFAKANVAAGDASREFRLGKSEGEVARRGRRAQGRHVQAGPDRRRHRHHDRQGFRRHHEAPQLRGRHEDPRQLGVAPRAGLHRPAPDAGPRVQGQAHVRPHGRAQPHHREPAHRRGRRRPQLAADQRRRAGLGGRPRDRASLGEGAGADAPPAARAEQGAGRRRRQARARVPSPPRRPRASDKK